ncbi:MAG: HAD family phosphatase [Blautia sp.]|nr:HAD family phosphatase [Blautia sp.]
MKGRKLFLTDLDGTLLNDEKVVTPKTMEALRSFTEAGNVFAICTGRAAENAMELKEQLGLSFPGSFVVGYNGALIYDCDRKESIYRKGIELPDVREILEISEEMGVHCHTYYRQYIVSKAYNECMTFYRRSVHSPVIVTDDVMREVREEPGKLIAIELHDHLKMERLRQELDKRYHEKYCFLFSNPWYMEIFTREAGKGTALLRLAEYLSIPRENTYAAGDAENDISMLEAAGTGIGMRNGTERVKEAADVVTEEDNNHDGLSELIRRM